MSWGAPPHSLPMAPAATQALASFSALAAGLPTSRQPSLISLGCGSRRDPQSWLWLRLPPRRGHARGPAVQPGPPLSQPRAPFLSTDRAWRTRSVARAHGQVFQVRDLEGTPALVAVQSPVRRRRARRELILHGATGLGAEPGGEASWKISHSGSPLGWPPGSWQRR